MNSLPRWFSRKGKKKKIEGGLDHDKHSFYSNVSVAKSVPELVSKQQQHHIPVDNYQNISAPKEDKSCRETETDSIFQDDLYVNGQVPRGQFREYFSTLQLDSYKEDKRNEPKRGTSSRNLKHYRSADFLGDGVDKSGVMLGLTGQPVSGQKDVLEDTNLDGAGSPNRNGLPSPQQGVYYNVQFARRIRSTVELTSSARASPVDEKMSLSSNSSVFITESTSHIRQVTQTVTDDNYDEVDTAQADMIAAQQTILQEQSLLEATVQYKQTHFIPIKQHLELETTLLALKAGSTDSLSQDSGKTGSLDDGNHYGTPRPSGDSSVRGEIVPGQHPSSEGKRRRNRSNVEAMAAKHMIQEQENKGGSPDSGVTDQSSLPKQSAGSAASGGSETNGEDDDLGPLPPNWEKSYTEKGEPYFIDHSTGTSHWLDPRLSRVQKLRPEDCEDNELPFGWERIDDPHYGTYYIDHVNRRTQYENPVLVAKAANQSQDILREHGNNLPPSPRKPPEPPSTLHPLSATQNDRPFFTRDPGQLKGEKIQAKLVKSSRGLGFTIVGGDDSEEEFLQIKSVVANGPAWLDGRLKTGDVLVYVNGTCVLGFTHHDMVTMFQNINPGEVVKLEVCRGYPLPFDPDDPNTEIVTTVAVNSPDQSDWSAGMNSKRELDSTASMPDLWRNQSGQEDRLRPGSADLLMDNSSGPHVNGLNESGGDNMDDPNPDRVTIPIVKGGMGFGFTIADSAYGQKVKKILDRPRCKSLQEGDILVEIDDINVQNMNHNNVVQVLKDCPRGQEAAITIQRGYSLNLSKNKFKKKSEDGGGLRPKSGFLFRSKTPTAELYATQEKEVMPIRPKTPIVDTRNMSQKSWPDNNQNIQSSPFQRNDLSRASLGVGGGMRPGVGGGPHHHHQANNSFDMLADQMGTIGLKQGNPRSHSPGRELDQFGSGGGQYNNYQHQNGYIPNGYDSGYGYSGYHNGGGPGAATTNDYLAQVSGAGMGYSPNGNTTATTTTTAGSGSSYRAGSLPRPRKDSTTNFDPAAWGQSSRPPTSAAGGGGDLEMVVILRRHDSGFGFRIVGGTEEGSQVSIGHIVPGGAADMDGRLFSGDEIVAVDNQSVVGASHHVVVGMMGSAAQRGQVQLTIRRRQYQEGYPEGYPYDVTVSRLENEGFGFVIISSVSRAGSTIGRIIPGSPAERCGRLHVGDRILAVNHVDINSLHHEKIINIIKESGYSVTLTVGPPLDDTSSTASTSHRSSNSSMLTGWARPVQPPADSLASSSVSSINYRSADAREVTPGSTHSHSSLRVGPHHAPSHPGDHHPYHPNAQAPLAEGVKEEPRYDYYQQEDQEVGAHLGEEDQYFAVELARGNRGFGFSIRGGREFHSMPLFVLRMAVDGPAAADGRLRVGDQLIEINGQSTRNMTHAEAIETIKNRGATVRLLVKRGKAPPPAILDQMNMTPSSVTPLPLTRPVSSLSQPAGSQPQYPGGSQHYQQNSQSSYTMNQSANYNNNSQNFSMNSSSNMNYSMNNSQSAGPYMGGPNGNGGPYSPPSGGTNVPPPSGSGNGPEQPVSHSSPRYPPQQQGYMQQPYWGYHQQSVE